MSHYVYILECADKTFYIGYTIDLERRLSRHNHFNSGARYTKTRRPVVLKYYETYKTQKEALRREYALKKLKRQQKMDLIRKSSKIDVISE